MKTKRPYDVKDTDEFIGMESDNYPGDPAFWSILHNGNFVSIHKPYGGAWIEIPRDQFNAIVDWYMKPQNVEG